MRAILAVLTLLALAGCESTGPASPLKGDWRGALYGHDMVLSIDERGGSVNGSAQWGEDRMPLTSGTFTPPTVEVTMNNRTYDGMYLYLELLDGDSVLFGSASFRGSLQLVRLRRE